MTSSFRQRETGMKRLRMNGHIVSRAPRLRPRPSASAPPRERASLAASRRGRGGHVRWRAMYSHSGATGRGRRVVEQLRGEQRRFDALGSSLVTASLADRKLCDECIRIVRRNQEMEIVHEVQRFAPGSESVWRAHAARGGALRFPRVLRSQHRRQRVSFQRRRDHDWPAKRHDAYARQLALPQRASCPLADNMGSAAVCRFSLHNRP